MRRDIALWAWAATFALWLVASSAWAASNGIHGRLELQDAANFSRSDSIEAALGERNRNDLLGNLRLIWAPHWGNWSATAAYVVSGDHGGNVPLRREESSLLAAPPLTLFDLTDTIYDKDRTKVAQRIDRLSVGYTGTHLVVRLGRQALTWGSGLVFRPMDLFDPFSPSATDTEYKPGTDMLYTQWLFNDGSDLQFIVVPHANHYGSRPTSNASSIALHLHTTILGHQTTWLIARDHGDWVAAVGLNGALGGATWNLELIPTFLERGPTRVSALANISTAMTLFDRNATVFAEYYHNGFGADGSGVSLATLPSGLRSRLARGQVFNLRKNYLAAGITLEVTPLLNINPTIIADLDDGSALMLLSGTYSLGDNLSLVAGAQIPIGSAHTEFGGIPVSAANPERFAPPAQIYVQLRRYF